MQRCKSSDVANNVAISPRETPSVALAAARLGFRILYMGNPDDDTKATAGATRTDIVLAVALGADVMVLAVLGTLWLIRLAE